MRMIESDKVIPLMRLLLLFNPKADAICKDMQDVVDIHTIDAVPVVRCRECQSFQADEIAAPETGTCWNCEMVRQFDDFCSYGERKDGEG